MNCNFYKARCKTCESELAYPLLSDFAYGEFIFSGSDGVSFRYLSAFECEVWEEISSIIKSNGLSALDRNDYDIEIFQSIVGSVIDESDEISFQLKGICPKCKSSDLTYSDNELIYNRDIPIASFTNFSSLDEVEKTELIISRWNASKSR